MSALQTYMDYVRQQGNVSSTHPVAVVVGALSGPVSTREVVNEAAPEAASPYVAQALAENPLFCAMEREHHLHREVMLVVQEALNFIFSGKEMYTPPELRQRITQEALLYADEFKKQSATNPNLCISQLKAKIGKGSKFATQHHEHLLLHHPEHPETHEKHGDHAYKPSHGHAPHAEGLANVQHQGVLQQNPELAHYFGAYHDHP